MSVISLTGVGLVLLGLGGAMAALNFYLTWIRVPLLRSLGHPHQWVSGIPLVGSVLLVAAAILLRHHAVLPFAALALVAVDTGGPLWLVISLVRSERKPDSR